MPFITAGVVAGKIDKTDWAGAMKKRIFDAAGHGPHAAARGRKAIAQPDHATPHYYGFDKSVRAVEWDQIDHAGGAGCINSTARDMGAWLQFQLAGGKYDGKRLLAGTRPEGDAHPADGHEARRAVRRVLPREGRRGSPATAWAGSFTTTAA